MDRSLGERMWRDCTPAGGQTIFAAVFLLLLLLLMACTRGDHERVSSVPVDVEAEIASITDDIARGRYEKIYHEAAEEWRRDATLEESNAVFENLKAKLGTAQSRTLQSATEGRHASESLPGHSFVLIYETKFKKEPANAIAEPVDAIETFTLVERDGHWLLARYSVNSTKLQ